MQDTEVPSTPRSKRRCLSSSDIRLSSPVQDKHTFALSSSQVNNFIEEVREVPNLLDLQIEEANRYLAFRIQELRIEQNQRFEEEVLEIERHRRNIAYIIEEVD